MLSLKQLVKVRQLMLKPGVLTLGLVFFPLGCFATLMLSLLISLCLCILGGRGGVEETMH